ncbi:HNH endonuclease, partial [Geodermatophilus sp. CPCC 205761]
ARGWRFVMDADGTLHVTTPSGVTRTTRPPGLHTPAPEPEAPADHPPHSPVPADDPPPF